MEVFERDVSECDSKYSSSPPSSSTHNQKYKIAILSNCKSERKWALLEKENKTGERERESTRERFLFSDYLRLNLVSVVAISHKEVFGKGPALIVAAA